jgi:hypothetical protein
MKRMSKVTAAALIAAVGLVTPALAGSTGSKLTNAAQTQAASASGQSAGGVLSKLTRSNGSKGRAGHQCGVGGR